MPRFTVIIPTLNEAAYIRRTLQRVRDLDAQVEIIVSDGGSGDGTIAIARSRGVTCLKSGLGRGAQCHAGAMQAGGDILLFLHADTLLPDDAFALLERQFTDTTTQLATFRLRFDTDHWLLRTYAWFSRFDSVFTTFGDQGIAIRRDFYHELGGFPDWPLFEDVSLLQAARQRTGIISLPAAVTTSARRFIRHGILRTQLRNAGLMLRYLCGVSPHDLATEYIHPPELVSE